MTLEIYTDGSCIGKEPFRFAGYGVAFGPSPFRLCNVSAPLADNPQTNQRAELMALLVALRRLDSANVPVETSVVIYSDSAYSINCVTKWMPAWLQKGWLTATGAPVKNRDIIEPLSKLYEQRRPHCRFEWVKGHAGCEGNIIADRLATDAAAAVQRQVMA